MVKFTSSPPSPLPRWRGANQCQNPRSKTNHRQIHNYNPVLHSGGPEQARGLGPGSQTDFTVEFFCDASYSLPLITSNLDLDA